MISGFAQTDQPQLLAKYRDEFFASLHTMYKSVSYNQFKYYLHGLMPRKGEITDEMIGKLQDYLAQPHQANNSSSKQAQSPAPAAAEDSDKAFHKLIKETIELLQR